MKIELERKNNAVYLEAKNDDGIIVKMDGSPEIGGENLGARPMQMVLMALGGCSSMDVLSILKKMRENVKSYKVIVEAERAETEPKVFTKIHVHYILSGIIKKENAEKAIQLSMDKYCSVSKMLEKSAELTHSFELID
ncbi:MAG TPA: OsmC family protein [Chitinophagales bacterium]|nr:OsmC family protein [Chitinophagales bacterium]MCB0511385.1 OsmC family protein [Bacteroidota bacterium]MCB0513766.1 OsmC family protein [Bacteroidota bacterium]MCB9074420.1 OsmC family protein [Chitinophagales bacterium]HMU98504.1 OsmC family protein [Chitinophagales bacterium]